MSNPIGFIAIYVLAYTCSAEEPLRDAKCKYFNVISKVMLDNFQFLYKNMKVDIIILFFYFSLHLPNYKV